MRDDSNVFKLVHIGVDIMGKKINPFLEQYDLRGTVLPAARLKDLERDFYQVLDKGLIDTRVRETYLKNFSFTKPDGMETLESIIVISMARPAHRLAVTYEGKKVSTLIPPTYVNYQKINSKVFNLLKSWMGQRSYRVYVARLPLKLVSARSGLIKYGRNNISYIKDYGSFHQLFAFYTDLVADNDPWQKMQVLEACGTCNLCISNCPTGAIKKDRFLLDSANCLTFLNESKKSIPSWVSPDAHNSLIGCMNCQIVCPYDRKVKNWIEDIGELDENETEMLLSYDKLKDKDSPIVARAKEMGIYEFFADLIPRNLGLLFNNRG